MSVALKRHLNRKHKGDDGSGWSLADVQVFVDSSSQSSSRLAGRLAMPPLTQGSGESKDSRGTSAGPSTPTVVESPQIRAMQIPAEAMLSDEDWWFQKLFPDEGTFGPSPPGVQSLSANKGASSSTSYRNNQVDHLNAFTMNDTTITTPSQYGDASSFAMAP
ncbi:hypothetical protein ACEPAI_4900 [Sanghuangporus weigelae]